MVINKFLSLSFTPLVCLFFVIGGSSSVVLVDNNGFWFFTQKIDVIAPYKGRGEHNKVSCFKKFFINFYFNVNKEVKILPRIAVSGFGVPSCFHRFKVRIPFLIRKLHSDLFYFIVSFTQLF